MVTEADLRTPDGRVDDPDYAPDMTKPDADYVFQDADLSRYFYSRPAASGQGRFNLKRNPKEAILW